jgi:hypothetical protein
MLGSAGAAVLLSRSDESLGVTPVTLTVLRAANITRWGPIQLGWSSFFLIFYVSYLSLSLF